MPGDACIFLVDLPDDVFGLISGRLCHRDLCNLSATCSKLRGICNSDKLWLPQCERLVEEDSLDLNTWRTGMQSYKALFKFLHGVKPLIGIWVHQNPELGNLVYVTWGFLSAVGCRVIPQELGPRGMDCGLLWAPVFEVVGMQDGSLAFFLYGRDRDDCCYPGRFEPAKYDCNVLLLEVESFKEPVMLLPKEHYSPVSPDSTLMGVVAEAQSDGEESHLKTLATFGGGGGGGGGFSRLSFGDRRRLLEVLVTQIRIKLPALAQGPLFSRNKLASRKELKAMTERHALLLWMYFHGDPCAEEQQTCNRVVRSEVLSATFGRPASGAPVSSPPACVEAGGTGGTATTTSLKKNGLTRYFRSKMKMIIGGNLASDCQKKASVRNVEGRRLQLCDYLQQNAGVGLRLQAASLKLTLYRAWPIISENRFALYKLPEQIPTTGREYAGLWGGTFGWPPGKPAEDKPGKPLFFLVLSYEENEEGRLLIGTKILEGTHYVLHPNGSAMFTARMDLPSSEVFPWDRNRDGSPVDMLSCYSGEGIASGYGFRYPGSKPGDLFVERSGLLAFVWRESRAVLSLQRVKLNEMLRKGEKVAPLPPVANFAYLTKANSNVFAGYSGRSFEKHL